MRRSGPDVLKGLLLVLVVFGHTVPQSVHDSFTKWLIYGVHMPAFLFLSGYLVSVESLHRRTFGQFVRHYWRRMLLPWLVVSLIWGYTYGSFERDDLGHTLTELVLRPQWHLWYIPVLFAMLTLAWVTVRLDVAAQVLGTAAAVGVVVWGTPLGDHVGPADPRYLAYLIWFVLGFAVRNGELTVGPAAARVLAVTGAVGAVVYAGAYVVQGQAGAWAAALGFVALNTAGVLLVVPRLLAWFDERFDEGGLLAFAGRNSLWIYLLHPFVTEPLREVGWPAAAQRPAAVALTAAVFAVVALAHANAREKVSW